MAAAHAARAAADRGAGGVLRRRARPRRTGGSAALSARRARGRPAGAGRGADAGRRTRAAARRRPFPRGDRGRRGDAVRGDGAVSERIAAVRRELEPLAALDPALAPQVERLSDAAAIDRGCGARSRSVRARRALRPGAPRRDRRAPVPAVAAHPQARRLGGGSRRPARRAGRRAGRGRLSYDDGARRAPGHGRPGGRAGDRGGGRAVRVPQARGFEPGAQGRCDAARARVRLRPAADRDRGARAGRGGRRPCPLPVRAQPRRSTAPAGARSRRAASCRG